MKLKHLIHAALLLLITPLTQAQFATGDVAVFEKKSTAGFELKAVEDTGLILPLANGGLGASLTDPGADRIPFWDDSGTTVTWLTLGTGLSITGTTINASAVLGDADYGDIVVSSSGTAINIDTGRKSTGALGSGDAGKLATFAAGGYLMGTVVSAGDSVTPGNDYITLETDAVNGQVIRGYHTDGMDEHEYILHLPTTSMSDTSVEWWLPEALPTVNGQVLTGQTDGTTAWATASGGSPGGSSGDVQYNNGGAFGGVAGMTTTTGTLSALSLSGQSLTGSTATNGIAIASTWNTTGNPALIYGLVTNTASGATAKLIDLGTVAAGSLFKVDKSGNMTVAGTATIGLGTIQDMGSGQLALVAGRLYVQGGFVSAYGGLNITTSTYGTGFGAMLMPSEVASHILELRSGANAQCLGVYNTRTSSTNYERFVIDWQASPNVVKIGTQRGSTGGEARDVEIVTDNVTRITVKASGAILFSGLPGTDPGVSGQLWNDSGTLKVSP